MYPVVVFLRFFVIRFVIMYIKMLAAALGGFQCYFFCLVALIRMS
jgi:hypothetical protein